MTQEREEFEMFVRRTNGTWADKCLTRSSDGRYNILQTWNDWIAWQACWAVRDALSKSKNAPVVEVPTVDLIEGSLYLNSTDEGDDGKWIEAKDYRKVAQAIALLQSRNEPVEVPTIAELKLAYQTGFDKEWESPEWTGDDEDEDDMDRRDASVEAGWESIRALLQSKLVERK